MNFVRGQDPQKVLKLGMKEYIKKFLKPGDKVKLFSLAECKTKSWYIRFDDKNGLIGDNPDNSKPSFIIKAPSGILTLDVWVIDEMLKRLGTIVYVSSRDDEACQIQEENNEENHTIHQYPWNYPFELIKEIIK